MNVDDDEEDSVSFLWTVHSKHIEQTPYSTSLQIGKTTWPSTNIYIYTIINDLINLGVNSQLLYI